MSNINIYPNEYPCPCCGFLTFDEPPGSYSICGICGWEDDHVQLKYPGMGGGANGESLFDSQKEILNEYPVEVLEDGKFKREVNWRPLKEEEVKMPPDQPTNGYEYFRASWGKEPIYYWIKTWFCDTLLGEGCLFYPQGFGEEKVLFSYEPKKLREVYKKHDSFLPLLNPDLFSLLKEVVEDVDCYWYHITDSDGAMHDLVSVELAVDKSFNIGKYDLLSSEPVDECCGNFVCLIPKDRSWVFNIEIGFRGLVVSYFGEAEKCDSMFSSLKVSA